MNPTLHFGDTTIPGAEFGARVQRAASALAACGIKGDPEPPPSFQQAQ